MVVIRLSYRYAPLSHTLSWVHGVATESTDAIDEMLDEFEDEDEVSI
jgi:hypothetical protein